MFPLKKTQERSCLVAASVSGGAVWAICRKRTTRTDSRRIRASLGTLWYARPRLGIGCTLTLARRWHVTRPGWRNHDRRGEDTFQHIAGGAGNPLEPFARGAA